jgi:plasmid maintenance system antidote protein VapI
MRLPRNRPPTHPGEILLEEFLVPLDMTQTQLAEGRRVAAATSCPHPARV